MDLISDRFAFYYAHIRNKYYSDISLANPLHSNQYTAFLYFVANTIYKRTEKPTEICDKVYNLSKMLSGADIYYEVELPSIFMFDHPVGSVIGRATYSDYFAFDHSVTVGDQGDNRGAYPKIGRFVIMFSGSKIVGSCSIGNNVIISANTYIKGKDIPDNSIVFGSDRSIVIKSISEKKAKSYFSQRFLI